MSKRKRIISISINPSREGIEHIAQVFSQEIDRATETIKQAEKIRDYLDGEEAISQLPAFIFGAITLISEGLELLIEQEERRIESQQSGLDECNRCLAQPENQVTEAEQTQISASQPPQAKAYLIKPGDRIGVRTQLGNGQPIKPKWIAGQSVTVVEIGRSTLTVQPDDGKQLVKLSNKYFDLKTHTPAASTAVKK